MKNSIKKIKANDGLPLNTYQWMPEKESDLKGILLLVHGSVEHAKRYERFGEFLTKNGIGVYAFDQRGHGRTTDLNSPNFSHIAYKTGWDQLLDDVLAVHNKIKNDYPNMPKFLFGHSMGSFLVRDYISNRSSDFNGLVLSGTTYGGKTQVSLLLKVAKLMTVFYKPNHKSKLLHNLVYGALNKGIDNPETSIDFVSTDKKEIQKYLADELSGQTISIGYAHEMGKGLLRARSEETLSKIPKELPILMVSGEDDPVGGKKGDQVIELYEKYKEIGLKDVTLKLYKGSRHEILNDKKRDEVMDDILRFMKEKI